DASRRRRREVFLVERVVGVAIALPQPARSDHVGPIHGAALIEAAAIGAADEDRERRARLNRGDARNLPPAEDLAIEPVLPTQQLVARADRNIQNINAHEAMADIE